MIKKNKIFIAVLIMIVLNLFSSTCFAATDVPETVTKDVTSAESGKILAKYMQSIIDNYNDGSVNNLDLLEGAMKGMTSSLDKYSYYMTSSQMNSFSNQLNGYKYFGGVYYILKNGNFYVSQIEPKSDAENQNIKIGDEILSIDEVMTSKMNEEEVYNALYLSNNDTTTLVLLRDNIKINVTLKKSEFNETVIVIDLSELNLVTEKEKYFYISINQFDASTTEEFKFYLDQLKKLGVKNVILDLRGNPGGFVNVANDILNLTVPQGPLYSIEDKKGNKNIIYSDLKNPPFNHVVLLVDGNTASASELITIAMKDRGIGTIVGEQTYGKGVGQILINEPTGGTLRLTSEIILRNSGKTYNKIGITPDVKIGNPMKVVLNNDAFYESNGTTFDDNIASILLISGYSSINDFKVSNQLINDDKLDNDTIALLNKTVESFDKNRDYPLVKAVEILKKYVK